MRDLSLPNEAANTNVILVRVVLRVGPVPATAAGGTGHAEPAGYARGSSAYYVRSVTAPGLRGTAAIGAARRTPGNSRCPSGRPAYAARQELDVCAGAAAATQIAHTADKVVTVRSHARL